ncbi:hypothetical protein Krac_7512 [Ktedonobacter racemifer DSM 44963]|uniref:Uncharacterized protein n=1 Tax=Ktedonobacter racemifer DSM 44963 TaxID=485913 RepID=D6TKC2_KTERA|nr:hypothetical protein Krac_7512 [Ktedonobacter racemifer DSM 44963]
MCRAGICPPGTSTDPLNKKGLLGPHKRPEQAFPCQDVVNKCFLVYYQITFRRFPGLVIFFSVILFTL